jgi:hypothetical protein
MRLIWKSFAKADILPTNFLLVRPLWLASILTNLGDSALTLREDSSFVTRGWFPSPRKWPTLSGC